MFYLSLQKDENISLLFKKVHDVLGHPVVVTIFVENVFMNRLHFKVSKYGNFNCWFMLITFKHRYYNIKSYIHKCFIILTNVNIMSGEKEQVLLNFFPYNDGSPETYGKYCLLDFT